MRSTGVTGAASEMITCVDLLRRGFEVFRAVSPSCECDLIALRDGQCWRIEVRTGNRSLLTYALSCPLAEKDRGRFDVLAIVLENEVSYLPERFVGEPFAWPLTGTFRKRVGDYTGDHTLCLEPMPWTPERNQA